MNRSNISPRSFSTDQLHAALGDAGGRARPDYLADIVAQAGRTRQRPAWTFLERWLSMDIAARRQGVPRAAVVFASLSLLVALLAAGLVYIGSQLTQPQRPPRLPATPGAWERVVIDAGPSAGGVTSLAASPHGLLAAVGEGDESRLYFSVDGRTWTEVPADQIPPLSNPSFGVNSIAVAGDNQRILIVGREVLASENGLDWQRVASPADDPDLGQGAMIAATAAGPGFVAVGALNKAWYSTDGTDWALAEVPPPPGEPSVLERPLDRTQTQGTVEMERVAVSGSKLLAWGKSIWVHDDGSATFVPVFWASSDGLSWTSVLAPGAPEWIYPAVAGGPDGFVVAGEDGRVWFSADGESWERVAEAAFGSSRWPTLHNDDRIRIEMHLSSIAAGVAGYVAVGTDGVCLLDCSSEETVIWTSPDGRTWSRLPSDARFARAGAGPIVAWGSRFVVGGEHEDQPVIWISD